MLDRIGDRRNLRSKTLWRPTTAAVSSRVEELSVLVTSTTGTSVTVICCATDEIFTVTGMERTCPTVRLIFSWMMVVKPGLVMVSAPRFSTLRYAGSVKLSRLPPRSAVVAFSAEQVYALAEMLRRFRGGAAVVMGVPANGV